MLVYPLPKIPVDKIFVFGFHAVCQIEAVADNNQSVDCIVHSICFYIANIYSKEQRYKKKNAEIISLCYISQWF